MLGGAAASLVVPFIAFFALRNFDFYLIRQTEGELSAQGAVVAAMFQEQFAQARGRTAGNPRSRFELRSSYTPLSSNLDFEGRREGGIPDELPGRQLTLLEKSTSASLGRVLRNAQVTNLSGVRVLAPDGCAVASSRAQIGTCFSSLPEVQRALSGHFATALRDRVSDEPAPPLASLSRRGETRVFVALPVWNDGEIIGAVWLSRTAESGAEWLFKRRRAVLFAALLVLGLTTAVSIAFSWFITRPLSLMSRLLRSDGEGGALRLADVTAPREIHALGVALDERARQLEDKSRYVAEFAANVSHELKTPLTSIRGAAELLQDSWDQMDGEQRLRFLRNIDAAAERTERLVTRLLYLARLESNASEEDLDLVTVEVLAEETATRYGDEVQFDVALESGAKVSRSAWEAVLGNLIENALRYRRKAPVFVRVSRDEPTSRLLHVAVTDDGAGIAEDNRRQVFERFFTTERDAGGTGLGLSIVRATAEKNGGRAQLRSDSSGTHVDVWL